MNNAVVIIEQNQERPPNKKLKEKIQYREINSHRKHFQKEIPKELEAGPHTEEVEIEWAHIQAVINKVAEKMLGYFRQVI